MNTLYKMLDRLESIIMDGIPIPFLPYSMVNQEKLIMLLDKIQTAIPDEVQKADQILSHQEELHGEAQRRAQQILVEAQQQAQLMLSESELLRAVHIEAERVRQQVMTELQSLRQQTIEETDAWQQKTYEDAKLVRESADEYADTVLKTLGRNLEEFQAVAKQAQKQLKKTRAEALQTLYPQNNITSGAYANKPKEVPTKPGHRPEWATTDLQELNV